MYMMEGNFGKAVIMIPIEDLGDSCVAQIQRFLDHPAFTEHMAIMADAHAGAGAVIGFTMPLVDRVIPNIIGVDIDCAVHSFMIGTMPEIDLDELDAAIRAQIPFGANIHAQPVLDMENDFPWNEVNARAQEFVTKYAAKFGRTIVPPTYSYEWFLAKCRQIGSDVDWTVGSIGTLGSGNHFIEIGRSENTSEHWVTIHTGSRNLGKKIALYWQGVAVKRIREDRVAEFRDGIAKIKRETTNGPEIGDRIAELRRKMGLTGEFKTNGLEWLEGNDAAGYLFDMIFAEAYANQNRRHIARIICDILDVEILDEIISVHNFIDFDDMVIRKGAIRSYRGERMVIPFNRQYGVLICEGRSNDTWNCSAPHGAGRAMSRADARRNLSMNKYQADMTGIHCTDVCPETLEEAPDAYKDPKVVREAIGGTAIILDRIVPIHTFKCKNKNKDWAAERRARKAAK